MVHTTLPYTHAKVKCRISDHHGPVRPRLEHVALLPLLISLEFLPLHISLQGPDWQQYSEMSYTVRFTKVFVFRSLAVTPLMYSSALLHEAASTLILTRSSANETHCNVIRYHRTCSIECDIKSLANNMCLLLTP